MNYHYLSQWNNQRDPSSSCVLTCLAMVLFKKPDQLWLDCKQRAWDRLAPETVDRLSALYHQPYKIKKDLTFENIVPGTILYGSWTAGGHCVLVTSNNNSNLIYHDPLGVFDGKKYDYSMVGESQNVSKNDSAKYIGYCGEIWGHLPV